MYKEMKVAVVVPSFNEGAHIADVVKGIPSFVDFIVVVDDSSTDSTPEIIADLQEPRLKYFRSEKNEGVGGAIIRGHDTAMGLGADIDVVMAGDDQMDPRYLPRLLDAIIEEGYDYAKGNRFLRSDHLRGMPKQRVFGSYFLALMTKMASGYWQIFDPQNGYTALRMSVYPLVDAPHIAKRYQFENDMLVHLNVIGARVKDVPIPSRYKSPKSGIRPGRFALRTTSLLIRRSWWRFHKRYLVADFHPIAPLTLLGFPLTTWGVLFSLYILYERYLGTKHAVPSTGTVMLAALPLFIGFQLLLTAWLMDINESRELSGHQVTRQALPVANSREPLQPILRASESDQ